MKINTLDSISIVSSVEYLQDMRAAGELSKEVVLCIIGVTCSDSEISNLLDLLTGFVSDGSMSSKIARCYISNLYSPDYFDDIALPTAIDIEIDKFIASF